MDFVTESMAASSIFLLSLNLSLNATSENGLKSSDFSDVATGFVTSVFCMSGIDLAYCFCTKSFLELCTTGLFRMAGALLNGLNLFCTSLKAVSFLNDAFLRLSYFISEDFTA